MLLNGFIFRPCGFFWICLIIFMLLNFLSFQFLAYIIYYNVLWVIVGDIPCGAMLTIVVQTSPQITLTDRDFIAWRHDAAWRRGQVKRLDARGPASRAAMTTELLIDLGLHVHRSTLVSVPDDSGVSGGGGRRRSERLPRAARRHLRRLSIASLVK